MGAGWLFFLRNYDQTCILQARRQRLMKIRFLAAWICVGGERRRGRI